MKCYRSVLFACLLFMCCRGWAQDFSNKGKDFWLGYGYHVNMGAGVNQNQQNLQDMVLYFTSDKNANVTVTIPGVGYTKTYTVSANQVTSSDPIPKTGAQDARVNTIGIFDRGIHVTSDVPIVAYAHIYNSNVSGASLLFPTNTLGKEYYCVSYTQSSNASFANGFFFVVATEDNTTVEITPSAANLNGMPVGVPFTVTLNAGQIYNMMGTTNGPTGTDLTGSRIRSISGNGSGGCKKIAVFSGSGKISIGGVGANGSADNLFAQALPAAAWGKKYLTVPTGGQPNNFYRVCVTDPTTVVKLNGVVLPAASLQNNFYYQFKNANASGTNPPVPNLIESDKPIMVAQYCTTQAAEGNPNNANIGGDPEMIYLSPVEQTINDITLYSASKFMILQSYINVVIRKEGVASFKLDGGNQAASFVAHPQESNYSYATFTVSAGSHSLYSDSGFNAIAYGFGSAESYGYNAGTNVKDFTKTTSFQNPYNRIDSAVTCTNTPFQFAVPLNFQPVSMTWDFSAAPNISPSANISPTPVYDSIGQGLYYYSPHKTFSFSKASTEAVRDTIKLYTTSSTPDGCGSTSQLYTIPVKVNESPVAGFSFVHSGCVSDSVKFIDKGSYNGTVGNWLWDYGDGTTEIRTTGDPFAKKYANGGSFTIKLKTIADIGCASNETTQPISIQSKPFAKFNQSSTVVCQGTETGFTDASSSTVGTIVKWIWDLNDGKGGFINTTNAAVKATYDSYGTKHPALQVETSNGCKSDLYDPGVLVNPAPEPGFILPEVCLNDASAQFTDTSKIAEGSIVAWLWNLNVGTPPVTPGPSNATSTAQHPSVKYNKSDYYKVSLTATSALGCKATITQDFTVNGSIPKAAFEIANAAPYCGTKPVQLKNNSTVDFGNVTRLEIYWDNTNAPTVKETIETPVSAGIYPHNYPDPPAPKQYTIRMLAYSGGTSCVSEISKTITVYPQPKAAYTVSASQLCDGQTVNFTDKSSTGSSAVASWTWDLGKGDISNVQNPSKQYHDSGLISTSLYFYNKDGCISDTAKQQLTIYPNPQVVLQHKAVVLEGGVITIKPEWVYGKSLQYLWTPATYLSSDTATAPKATPQDDITYKLNLTAEGGCTASDTIFIRVLKGPVVPNVFSPNGDGINDTWYIKYLDGYPGATVDVYDRGGQLVYHSVGYDKEWDGSYKGKPLEIGTYYYIINPRNGKPTISGSVTIIK